MCMCVTGSATDCNICLSPTDSPKPSETQFVCKACICACTSPLPLSVRVLTFTHIYTNPIDSYYVYVVRCAAVSKIFVYFHSYCFV